MSTSAIDIPRRTRRWRCMRAFRPYCVVRSIQYNATRIKSDQRFLIIIKRDLEKSDSPISYVQHPMPTALEPKNRSDKAQPLRSRVRTIMSRSRRAYGYPMDDGVSWAMSTPSGDNDDARSTVSALPRQRRVSSVFFSNARGGVARSDNNIGVKCGLNYVID